MSGEEKGRSGKDHNVSKDRGVGKDMAGAERDRRYTLARMPLPPGPHQCSEINNMVSLILQMGKRRQ